MPLEITYPQIRQLRKDSSHTKKITNPQIFIDKSELSLTTICRIFDLEYKKALELTRYFNKIGEIRFPFSQKGNELYLQVMHIFPFFDFLTEQEVLHFLSSEKDGEIQYENKDGTRIRLFREKQ